MVHTTKELAGAGRKPGSVPATGYPATGGDHSSRAAVADGLKQPTRKHERAALDASLLGLAPGGVYLASDVTAGPGELLPHPFTLTRRGGRTSLCGTFPGVAPAGRYPAPCPLEPGLSSPPKGAAVTWPAPAKPVEATLFRYLCVGLRACLCDVPIGTPPRIPLTALT